MADFGSFLGMAGFGGGAIGSALVKLQLDSRQYQGQLQAAHAQTQTSANAMGTGFAKFSALAKSGMLVGGAALAGFAVTAVKAAADLGESMNKAEVVFGSAASSVIAFSETSASSFGIAQAAALEAAGSFGAMGLSAGLSEKAAADMSIQLVKLSADMASFNNADPSEVLDKLRSGLAGEAEPLRKFHVLLSAARVEAEAYRSGIAKVNAELTEGQKVQSRFNLIMADTAKQQGDFARTIGESLPGQIRKLKAEFTDLSAQIGQALIPAALAAAEAFNDLLESAGPLIDLIGKSGPYLRVWGEVFQWLNTPILTAANALGLFETETYKVSQALASTEPWIRELGEQARSQQVHFEAMAQKAEIAAGGVSKLGGAAHKASGDVRAAFEEISESLKDELPKIIGTVTTFKETFDLSSNELKKITDSWARIAKTIASDLETLAESDLKPAMKAAIAGLPPEMRHAWVEGNANQRKAIENSIRNTLNFQDVINDTVDDMVEGGRASGKAFSQGIAAGINQYVGLAITAAANAVQKAIDAAREAAEATSPSKKMERLGRDMIEGLIEGLEAEQDRLRDRLATIVGKAMDLRSTVRGGFGSFLDISGAFGLSAPGDIQGFFASQVAGAQQFAGVLNALQAQGASSALLSQIAGGGAGAVPFAQSLLQMGPEAIAGFSQSLASIQGLAGTTARGLSEGFFGSKIDELKEEMRRNTAELRELRHDFRQLEVRVSVDDIDRGLSNKVGRGGSILNGLVKA